ncbi:MAG TPA: sigma-70 family RNA polymerase sigma factor [Opitutus sp.]|nr:sigma-70 family RNA polymerase sigma factor [Opitutus sp.]
MNDDAALLRSIASDGSEAAFAELVRRHVDLVYAAAMRRTGGDGLLAADVTQQVFTHLARSARDLANHAALGAWLHAATRNAAIKAMLAEQRRRAREASAAEPAPAGAVDLDWEKLRPLIDDVIDELPESERAALVLRFFERRQFTDLGAALGMTEDEARAQTERALETLREALHRRGLASTGAALAAIVSGQPVMTAPAGLATAVAAQSFAGGGSKATRGGDFPAARWALLAAGGAAAFAIGIFIGRQWRGASDAADRLSHVARSLEIMRAENARLDTELQNARDELATLKETSVALEEEARQQAAVRDTPRRSPTLGMARYEVQQAVLNNLRQIAAARRQYVLEKGHPPASVQELVGRNGYIKAIRTVSGEDYSELAMGDDAPLTVTTPDGISVTYDPSGAQTTKPDVPPDIARVQELAKKVGPTVVKAVTAYRAANGGEDPPSEQALLPFFATPQEGADFVEYLDATKTTGGGP